MSLFWRQIKRACFDHRWLALAWCFYALLVTTQCVIVGVSLAEYQRASRLMMFESLFAFAFAFLMMQLFFLYLYVGALFKTPWPGKKKVLAYFLAAAKLFDKKCDHYFTGRLFAEGLVGFLILQAQDFVGSQKSLIPYINAFHWDPIFSRWDKALHFGHHPFQLILPFVESLGAWAPPCMAFLYLGTWFFAMIGTCFYCMFLDTSPYRHMRFMWTYMILWLVLGSICAVLFSSVGPVFFHDFYPQQPDIYKPLTEHLSTIFAGRFDSGYLQELKILLNWVRNSFVLDLNSISAMPSMHVAVAWLLFLYWSSVHRWMGVLAGLFFLVIALGSVYFGFHYAIDGYFAIVIVSLIWWGVGKLVRRSGFTARNLAG